MDRAPERIFIRSKYGIYEKLIFTEKRLEETDIEYTCAPQWVRIEDNFEFPAEGEWIQLIDNGNRLYGMLWWRDGDTVVWKAFVMGLAGPMFKTVTNVTHWMPLPPLPPAKDASAEEAG